ncbi:hypothetical protein STTU_0964 [Streptomyces sp. Tu6071]|nr:hypothetical protein STTU_0964 [Streptomyces sp. Tu6071]
MWCGGEVCSGDELVVVEEGADIVAVLAFCGGFVGLQGEGEAEEAVDAGAVEDEVVSKGPRKTGGASAGAVG